MPADSRQIRTKLVAMAQADVRKGDLSSALRRYKRLTGLEPTNPTFQIKLGDLALKLDKRRHAKEAYLAGAALFCRDAFEEKAIAIYRRVLDLAPFDLEVWGLLTDAYQRLDRTADAILALRAAVTKLTDEGHLKESMQLRRKIAQLDPTNIGMRLQLAHGLELEEMPEEAVSEYIECILQCAAQREWDRIAPTFEALVALRPEESADEDNAADEDRAADATDALLDHLFTSRRYEDALQDMYRRMSELGREQIRTLVPA